MNIDDIRTHYAYNRWATIRLLEAATHVKPEDFVRELGMSHGSLRGTLVHTMWAEWIWLQRWLGSSPRLKAVPEEYPDPEAVRSRWAEIDRDQRSFLDSLTHDHLAGRISYENLKGERYEYSLVQMMQHVVNHSTYHRGQVATILRQLGYQPPPTDFLVFIDEGEG